MNFDIVLLQQFERFEIFALERLGHVIFALYHWTVEGRLYVGRVWLLEGDVVANKSVEHTMHAGDMLVEAVQVLAELVADVTFNVRGEGSDIVLPEADTGDVLREGHSHSVLIFLRKSKVSPEVFL